MLAIKLHPPFFISATSKSKLKISNETIKSSTYEKLLGTKIDNKLRLNAHVEDLCKKVSRKTHALAKVTPYIAISVRIFQYEMLPNRL